MTTLPTPRLCCLRGATTVDPLTPVAYADALCELLAMMLVANQLTPQAIVGAWFTATPDLTCDNPARIARTQLPGWETVPMLCAQEPTVDGALTACVRVMLQVYAAETPQPFVYLNGASDLRHDSPIY